MQRRSKITPSAFLRALVSSCTSEHFSLEVFCDFLKALGIKVSKQSLHERFNARTEVFLKEIST